MNPRNAALLARVRAKQDADGRLPVPDVALWDIFPFEGELLVKRLDEPVLPEPPRDGEGGNACHTCDEGVAGSIWADDRWMLRTTSPQSVPTVLLSPLEHFDSDDLPTHLVAALGPMLQRVERCVLSLGGVARVYLNKIGDGGAHLHWWFTARPEGFLQLRGSSLIDWCDALPPMPAEEWQRDMAAIGAAMVAGGGAAAPQT